MAILRIPVTKAGNKPIEVDTDTDLPDAMYQLALEEGLKILLNKGMSKIATKGLKGDDLEGAKTAAYAKAVENFTALKEGKIRKGRAPATADGKKVSGVLECHANGFRYRWDRPWRQILRIWAD